MSFLDTLVVKSLPLAPKGLVRIVSKKYIAGDTVHDAMVTVARLNAEGAMATVDVLGEFVERADVARNETDMSIRTLDEIVRSKVDANLSVKLTSLGLAIDKEFCYENVLRVVAHAASIGSFVRFDMENSPYTTNTIELFRRVRDQYPKSCGIVLQAYLRRTVDDVLALAPEGTNFRLCKGIYIEDEAIAFKGRDEIRDNYMKCLGLMFDHGSYVGIATHDDVLIDGAAEMIRERGLKREEYEYQMLLGVREPRRRQIIAQGHRLRVYTPFGKDWYGYATRRLQENPAIAGHIVKALFTGD
jgi:proline dehydrogenase